MGNAGNEGSLRALGVVPYAPIVGMAATADGNGYWEVAQDGGVFAFGDATYYGSMGGVALQQPIVGMAASPDSGGYWLVAADGGIFAFGDAKFYGSTGDISLQASIVGMAASPDGKGYWIAGSDGGIFAYGDAAFEGSAVNLGNQMSDWNALVVGMAATSDGKGYWLASANGSVYAYGDAKFYGSEGGQLPSEPVSGIAAPSDGTGYWLLEPDGWNYSFSSPAAPSPIPQAAQIVALADSQIEANPDANGQFCNPYGPCEAWCSLFTTWVWQQAGIPIPSYAFTGYVADWASQNGELLPLGATPAPGDTVMYGYSPDFGESLHVGIVEQVFANGAIVTAEGDSGPDLDGWYSTLINGPFLPGDPWAYNIYPVYAYAQPVP